MLVRGRVLGSRVESSGPCVLVAKLVRLNGDYTLDDLAPLVIPSVYWYRLLHARVDRRLIRVLLVRRWISQGYKPS